MESLDVKKEKVKNESTIDRVILGKQEAILLQTWVSNLNMRSDGLIKFSKSDVVNFLIRSHDIDWSEKEMCQISNDCFNETKWLSWALTKMRSAQKNRTSFSMESLEIFKKELLSTELVEAGKDQIQFETKKKRKKRESKNLAELEVPQAEGT